MFKKILILIKRGLEIDNNLIEIIHKYSSESEILIKEFDSLKKSNLENIDLVITFGGDGTFVKAANLIEDSYILGINANPESSEGALTSLDIYELEKIKEIFKGNYEVLTRQRAKVLLNGKVMEERAINEVYVGAASQFHSSRYKIKLKEKEEEQRSSGVIISTGTGSAAWFYSAGGEVFKPDEEKLSFIVREPYFGKRIFTPKILNGDIKKGEKLKLESKRYFGGIVAINDAVYDFNNGDIVEVELADKPIRVIKLQ